MSTSSNGTPPGVQPAPAGRLDSWKEIAGHLRRSVRSAKRWEKEEGLPVHRHLHGKRDSVYAYRTELDEWWTSRGSKVADRNGAEHAVLPPEPEGLDAHTGIAEPARGAVELHAPPVRSRAALIGAGFALATLVVGIVAWLSHSGSGRVAGTLEPVPTQSRDWVLVASFENRTGEKLLDGTLDYALGMELSNSHRIGVVAQERVEDALRLMRKPPNSPIDAALAREVCVRDGEIRALLTGRVEKLSGYVLSVELKDPKANTTLAGFTESFATTGDSLAAVRRVSDHIRAALGEVRLPGDREGEALAKVTTSNLKALYLYSQAVILMRPDGGSQAGAEELLRQAIAEDPTFASAWIHLAWTLRNRGRPLAEFQLPAETAMRLADTTTERERYFIRGSYYEMLGEREKAIAAYEALLALSPDHRGAANNVCHLYDFLHDPDDLRKAVQVEANLADARPKDFAANWNAGYNFVTVQPNRARSEPYLRRAAALITPETRERFPFFVNWIELLPFTESWANGDLQTAATQIDRVSSTIDSLQGLGRDVLAVQVALGYLTLGRIEAAARTAEKIGNPVVRNDMIAQIAFVKGDGLTLRHNLGVEADRYSGREIEVLRDWTGFRDTTFILQVRAGIESDAERYLKTPHWNDGGALLLRGEIALAHGDLADGIRRLEEACKPGADGTGDELCLGSLAAALLKNGDRPRAIEVLERDPDRSSSVIRGGTGAFWLENRLELARLYRGVGRGRDAQVVEAELSKLLALADSDHPILLELRRLQRS
jgi:tetratricopeptide (TPR) repeat protein